MEDDILSLKTSLFNHGCLNSDILHMLLSIVARIKIMDVWIVKLSLQDDILTEEYHDRLLISRVTGSVDPVIFSLM